jgi:ABC-type thiamine transport system substrate-binding protein
MPLGIRKNMTGFRRFAPGGPNAVGRFPWRQRFFTYRESDRTQRARWNERRARCRISGGGLAAHAPNKAAAIKFLDYLASDEAQAIFAGANHEYPAVEGVPSPPDVAAISQFKADPMAVTVYGERQAQAQGVYDQAGWR